MPDLTQHLSVRVCVYVVCLLHCGRKEVTCHLVLHELLSLRLAGYITDANTEHWSPPGRSVARYCGLTAIPAAESKSCLKNKFKSLRKKDMPR